MKVFVDGKEIALPKAAQRLREILRRADLAPEGHYLQSKAGEEYHDPDGKVPTTDGACFFAQPKEQTPLRFKVNGEVLTIDESRPTLGEVLKKAGKEAGISPELFEHYYLEHVDTARRYEHLKGVVPLKAGDAFYAIYKGRTPVA